MRRIRCTGFCGLPSKAGRKDGGENKTRPFVYPLNGPAPRGAIVLQHDGCSTYYNLGASSSRGQQGLSSPVVCREADLDRSTKAAPAFVSVLAGPIRDLCRPGRRALTCCAHLTLHGQEGLLFDAFRCWANGSAVCCVEQNLAPLSSMQSRRCCVSDFPMCWVFFLMYLVLFPAVCVSSPTLSVAGGRRVAVQFLLSESTPPKQQKFASSRRVHSDQSTTMLQY